MRHTFSVKFRFLARKMPLWLRILCLRNSFSIHAFNCQNMGYKSLPFLDHKEVDVPLTSQKSSGISGVHFFSDLFVGRSFHGLCSSTPLVTLMQARKERQHFGVLWWKASLVCLFVCWLMFFLFRKDVVGCWNSSIFGGTIFFEIWLTAMWLSSRGEMKCFCSTSLP